MHPVQEHINTLGIDCSVQWSTEYHIYRKEGTVFQPRVLQLNLDNINWLPHGKYPDRKNQGIYRRGTRTHNLLCTRGRSTYGPNRHRPPFWQINHANSAYFRVFWGYFRVISATRPPFLHILDPPLCVHGRCLNQFGHRFPWINRSVTSVLTDKLRLRLIGMPQTAMTIIYTLHVVASQSEKKKFKKYLECICWQSDYVIQW